MNVFEEMGRRKGSKNKVKRNMGVSNKSVIHPYLKKQVHLDFPSIMVGAKQEVKKESDAERQYGLLKGHQRVLETAHKVLVDHESRLQNLSGIVNLGIGGLAIFFGICLILMFLIMSIRFSEFSHTEQVLLQDAIDTHKELVSCQDFIAKAQSGGIPLSLNEEQVKAVAKLANSLRSPYDAFCVASDPGLGAGFVDLRCQGTLAVPVVANR